jgi:16S rRNA (adenine1518-N6/adenine1519-N6)-dimethyltransferase
MQAKKSLGQNFLKSKQAIRDIIRAANLGAGEQVLEIGPGKGVLTEALLQAGARVTAVEKDDRLIPLLSEKFSSEIASGQLSLIHGDILDLPTPSFKFQASSFKLVANIPYYITGEILRSFLSGDAQPSTIVLLVQKEVAERIVARDGKESLLSLSVACFGTPKYIAKVPRKYFSPEPKVDSAVIAISSISKGFFATLPEAHFFRVLHAGFAHKRKVVASNLKRVFESVKVESALAAATIPDKARAENIGIAEWKTIAEHLK